ncbi:MAG: serine/threonine protein kinase [Blautia sp.]|nr:serine/threonine protein kinase [Blautia sp.]
MAKTTGKEAVFHYCLVRTLGEGAFSQVYLAEDKNGNPYACKVSREIKMLRREAEMLSRLYHPLFPAYLGYEESGGTGRLFMEYIPGRSLGQLARRRGGFSATQAMRITEELADGLRYLHERQPTVLYRDLKPDNIIVCEDGHVKIVDLGCACVLDEQGGERVGTPGFAPPEQLSAGRTAGIYSDVYGLGRTIQNVVAQTRRRRVGKAAGIRRRGKRAPENREKICCKRADIWRYEEKGCCSGDRKRYGEGGCQSGGRKHYGERGCHSWERKRYAEERKCRRRLEQMIEESTREDFRQRPQDMISISNILTGKKKGEEGIICEKNIWESHYKNPCSLP